MSDSGTGKVGYWEVTAIGIGGMVAFLDRAFGPGLLTGSANILLWLSYIVMLSLYAYAFGSYSASLFPAATHLFWKHVLISVSILGITGLNLLSAKRPALSKPAFALLQAGPSACQNQKRKSKKGKTHAQCPHRSQTQIQSSTGSGDHGGSARRLA